MGFFFYQAASLFSIVFPANQNQVDPSLPSKPLSQLKNSTAVTAVVMAIRFRIVRFIFVIAVLILIVQVLTTLRFSSMYPAQDSLMKARRNIYKFRERLQAHVGRSERDAPLGLPYKVLK